MSSTFKISGARFDRKAWIGQLQALLRGDAGWIPLKCMAHHFPEAATDPFKRGNILLLGKGSSRGVLVEPTPNDITLELAVLASDVDWDTARWLLAAAFILGAELTSDDGPIQSAEELKLEAFQARSKKILHTELGMSRAIAAKGEGDTLRFPVAHFELRLTNDDVASQELDVLMTSLVQQCYRYGSAHIASRMKWQERDGSTSLSAHYSSISTLVPADVQAITFSGPDGYYTDTPVPLETVKKVLAQFITPMGAYLYFPPIHWDQQPALLEALTGKSTKEILESLDRQFGEAMIRLPVLAFLLTAHADGEVDQKEMQAFLDEIKSAAANETDQSSFAKVCRHLHQELRQVNAGLKGLNFTAEFQLAVGQMDARMHAETRMIFKKRLYALAETIAKASGGNILGLGQKISEEERRALAWIHQALFASETNGVLSPGNKPA